MAGNMNRKPRGGMMQRDNKNVNMTGNKIEFRFLIPFKAASIIIGKGGDRIQRLRQECNARLSIPDNHGPERVFILESSVENCVKVWRDCAQELKEPMVFTNSEARNGTGSFRDEEPNCDIRFLVHDSRVGYVIGKAGVTIKNLKTQYQLTNIKVYPVTAPYSTDRVVQIVGKFDNVFECFRDIYNTLENQMAKGPVNNYNAENFDESLMPGYGGWPKNFGFDYSKRMGQSFSNNPDDRNSNQNGRFSNNKYNNSNNRFSDALNSSRSDSNRANSQNSKPPFNRFNNFNNNEDASFGSNFEMKKNFQNSFKNSSPNNHSSGFTGKRHNSDSEQVDIKRGRMSGGIGGGMNSCNFFNSRNDHNSMENRNELRNRFDNSAASGGETSSYNDFQFEKVDVSIPKTLIQAVKGINGEILSNIVSDSGAEISICDDHVDEDAEETILSLTGTKDQIDGAQYLLQICVKKYVLNL